MKTFSAHMGLVFYVSNCCSFSIIVFLPNLIKWIWLSYKTNSVISKFYDILHCLVIRSWLCSFRHGFAWCFFVFQILNTLNLIFDFLNSYKLWRFGKPWEVKVAVTWVLMVKVTSGWSNWHLFFYYYPLWFWEESNWEFGMTYKVEL